MTISDSVMKNSNTGLDKKSDIITKKSDRSSYGNAGPFLYYAIVNCVY